MSNQRNAILVGLAAACLVFITLTVATRLTTLGSLVIAIFGGGLVVAAAISRRPPPLPTDPFPVAVSVPVPPPVQFQSVTVTGVRLPSAFADYTFAFAVNVLWLPATNTVIGAGEIAVQEIIRRKHSPRLRGVATAAPWPSSTRRQPGRVRFLRGL
jgi:hypothetical protein